VDIPIKRGYLFFRRQHRNYKTLNVRTTLGSFLGNLTQPYNRVYAMELGASPVELGYLSAVGSAFAAAIALPGGLLADRCGRKKLYLIGSALGLLTPVCYLLARSWVWIVPAFVFSSTMIALRESAYQAMYAGSVRSEDRGTAFGIGSMLTSIPVILAPIAAVWIMGNPSRITPSAIRPLYLIQLLGLVLLLVFVYIFLTEDTTRFSALRSAFSAKDRMFLLPFMVIPPAACIAIGWLKNVSLLALTPPAILIAFASTVLLVSFRGRHRPSKNGDAKLQISEILRLPGVKAWLAMKGTGSFAMGLAEPFWLVFAAFVIGVSPAGLALMVSLRTLGRLVSALPWGIASDVKGRKFTLLSGRVFRHLGILCFIFATKQWSLILGYALMGVADGSSSAWTVIRMELVPSKSRGSMASLDHFVWYFPIILSAIVGGTIYSVSPRMIFLLCLLIDAGIRMPLVAFWVPETSKRKKRVEGTVP
jgi:MFS family permease